MSARVINRNLPMILIRDFFNSIIASVLLLAAFNFAWASGHALDLVQAVDIIKAELRLDNERPLNTEPASGDVVAQASSAVVSVNTYKDSPRYRIVWDRSEPGDPEYIRIGSKRSKVGVGSGFFISSSGYLLTNKHVVGDEDASFTITLSSGKEIEAYAVYRDPNHDIAILKADGDGFPFIKLGDSAKLRIGQHVVAIGNAYGDSNEAVASGIVSGLNKSIVATGEDTSERLRGMVQTSAPMYPGDSGGPLLDAKGEAVGINAASAIGTNISFSVPVNYAKEAIRRAAISI
jgi:S1-C subfamily serine protease